jgi:hypothetical protein
MDVPHHWFPSLQYFIPLIHIIAVFPTIDSHHYSVPHGWFTLLCCSSPLNSHHDNVPHHWFHTITMFPTMFSTIGFTSWWCSPPCSPPLVSHHDDVLHHWFHITTMFLTMFSTIDFTSLQCFPPCSQPLISHYYNVRHHVPCFFDFYHHWFTSQVELVEWKEEEHLAQLGKAPNKALEQDIRPGSNWLGWGYTYGGGP